MPHENDEVYGNRAIPVLYPLYTLYQEKSCYALYRADYPHLLIPLKLRQIRVQLLAFLPHLDPLEVEALAPM